MPTAKSSLKPPCHRQVMIVAGEASGDMYGAGLVQAMQRKLHGLTFCGVGGKYMRQAGVKIIYPAEDLAVVGLFEVFSQLGHIRQALKILTGRLRRKRPALLILIDFPDFNLILAKRAGKLGIPVFYYISPQVWAWRSGRVKTIAQRVNKLAVILPFEQAFYEDRGVVDKVEFVGHPLVDAVHPTLTAAEFRQRHAIGHGTVIGLVPGSRKKEISAILPDFIAAARLLRRENKGITFLLPLAPSLDIADLNLAPADAANLNIRIIRHERYNVMAACDLVMAASGTVTLELAILQIPMVVAYRISPLTYFVGRRLIKAKYAALVNLIAGREVVKELLQGELTADNMQRELRRIWPGTEEYQKTRQALAKVSASLGPPGASANAAALALSLMGKAV
ncbi:MAG: lipid-A-disaccharide synthase [Deltaproteobacteria bacterium]|nr:lipid-A-disaccharide synthase [Deltaproteobacteria bacterium]